LSTNKFNLVFVLCDSNTLATTVAGTTSNSLESFVRETAAIPFQVSFQDIPSNVRSFTVAALTTATQFSHISNVETFTTNGVFV
jgi:hypothetical protein